MAYNWETYLKIADQLGDKQHTALQRTSVSRAYYATFNLCRDWMEGQGVAIPNKGAHRALWAAFSKGTGVAPASVVDAAAIGGYGKWLSGRRNACDYDDRVANLDKVVKDALKRARLIIDDLLPKLI